MLEFRKVRFDHVGLVVPSIEEHLRAHEVLYRSFDRSDIIINAAQGVREMFLSEGLGRARIELLEPMGDGSPLAGYLRKHPDGGLVHLCYSTDDLEATVAEMISAGARLISGPTSDVGHDGSSIAFLFHAGQVVELVQH